MRPRQLIPAAALLLLGCQSPNSGPMRLQIQNLSVNLRPEHAPANYIQAVSGLITMVPGYKDKRVPLELRAWALPYSGAQAFRQGQPPDSPAVGGIRLRIMTQAVTAEGALLEFGAEWPLGNRVQDQALYIEVWSGNSKLASGVASQIYAQ